MDRTYRAGVCDVLVCVWFCCIWMAINLNIIFGIQRYGVNIKNTQSELTCLIQVMILIHEVKYLHHDTVSV